MQSHSRGRHSYRFRRDVATPFWLTPETRTHNIRKTAAPNFRWMCCSRARSLPAHDEMVIEDLTSDEGAEFLAVREE
jgi:hypothetical protein